MSSQDKATLSRHNWLPGILSVTTRHHEVVNLLPRNSLKSQLIYAFYILYVLFSSSLKHVLISRPMPCDTIKSYFSILSLYSLQTVQTLSHVNDFSHTHSNSLDQFARASWQSWGLHHSWRWILGQSFVLSSYTMAPWNWRTITFSAQLWARVFLYPDDASLLTCSWKAGTFRPGGLRHMTKAWAWLCWLAADQLVDFITCGVQQYFWVYYHTVRVLC